VHAALSFPGRCRYFCPVVGLDEYNRKRDFRVTREPPGHPAPASKAGTGLFVIQKHAASRLHYDFRLELDGVLKSWSVPKGPSLDPTVKRLAVHVEDHPMAYATFEGIIPKGEYGGGTVLLWDRGTWEPLGDPHATLTAGNLKFLLKGEKLHGRWALVKIKERRVPGRGDDVRNWLLIKERDAEARAETEVDITSARAESVATQRTLDQIAADPSSVWHSDRVRVDLDDVPGARVAAKGLLVSFRPPRPVSRTRPPSGPGWLHEMAIDGRRLLARAAAGQDVELLSETGTRLSPAAARRYRVVADAVRLLPAGSVVVDGMLTALFPDGRTRARGLSQALAGQGPAALAYYLTDLPFLDGHDLGATPLLRRKALLAELIARVRPSGVLRLSEHIAGDGAAFYREACRLGLPGMVSRRADAPYPGSGGSTIIVKCPGGPNG
jgi:bifunctional non-homologous end joining protein LigD